MFYDKTHMVLTEDGAYLIKPKTITGAPGFYQELTADVVSPPPDHGKEWPGGKPKRKTYGIHKVIFNDPATIVYWVDGTKTVVKCQPGDTYSRETGLALCIAKKFLGNKGNFNEVFKQWIPEEVGDINGIRVGDKVVITDIGYHYSCYEAWIMKNVPRREDQVSWFTRDRNPRYPHNGDVGVVKAIAPHGDRGIDLVYVQIGCYCYIFGVDGVVKV